MSLHGRRAERLCNNQSSGCADHDGILWSCFRRRRCSHGCCKWSGGRQPTHEMQLRASPVINFACLLTVLHALACSGLQHCLYITWQLLMSTSELQHCRSCLWAGSCSASVLVPAPWLVSHNSCTSPPLQLETTQLGLASLSALLRLCMCVVTLPMLCHTGPVYLAEMAPATLRGTLNVIFQLFVRISCLLAARVLSGQLRLCC